MSKTRKFAIVICAGLLGILLAAVVAVLLVVRTDWFREQVKQRIVFEVENASGGRVDIGAFSFDWHTLQAEIRPFVLHGTEGPGESPLLDAKSIRVGLKIVSAFRRDIDINLLRVEQPRIHIIVYPDGRTNLPEPKVARRHVNPVGEFLALAIGRFSIEDGLLEFDSGKIPLNLRGENLKTRLYYDHRGSRYTGEISSNKLIVQSPTILPLPVDVDSRVVLTSDQLGIPRVRIVAANSSIEATGAIKNLLSPRADFNFAADLSLQELAKLLRLPNAPRGKLRLAGNTSFSGATEYRLDAHLDATELGLAYRGERLQGLRLTSSIAMSPGAVELQGVKVFGFGGSFSGTAKLENLRHFRVSGDIKDISISQLGRLPQFRMAGWNGRVSGPVTISGGLARTQARGLRAQSRLIIVAETGDLPIQGSLDADYDQAAGTIQFQRSHLSTPSSRVQFEGTLGRSLRVSLESRNLHDFLPIAASLIETPPRSLPLALGNKGLAKFNGLVTGELLDPHISGHASVVNFQWEGQSFDRLTADILLSQNLATARSLRLEQGGMSLQGQGNIALENWNPVAASKLSGSFSVQGVSIEKVVAQAGQKFPLGGTLSGSADFSGTFGAPDGSGKFFVQKPSIYGDQFDRLRAEVQYSNNTLKVLSAQLDVGRAQVHGSGIFTHQRGDWRNGALTFAVSGEDVVLSQAPRLNPLPVGIEGKLQLEATGKVEVNSNPRLASLDGKMSMREVTVYGKPTGDLDFTASTKGSLLALNVNGETAGARVSGHSTWSLEGNYSGQGEVEFARLALSSLRPWWSPDANGTRLPIEGFADGKVTFSGRLLEPDSLAAKVEIPVLEIGPEEKTPEAEQFTLRNDGPILVHVDRKSVRIERAKLTGKDTNLTASGTVTFESERAFQLQFLGSVNLAALHNLDRDLTASGNSTVDASIRGPISKPEIYGRLDFKQASFYLSDIPNGIDKANGTILFSRDRATIEKITAETGGGKLDLSGFVGFGEGPIVYRLQADASQVRVRYPEGVSTTVDASLRLTGTAANSTLAGNVTILRSGVSPRVDLAGLLARSTKPLMMPGTQNELLRGMLFDVRIQTSPNARFETALTRDIQAEADLRLRGTPSKPVLLGRMSITQGEVNFFGTRYAINRGDISFLNPVKLEPVLNLDLATRVMGTDVNITFSGPLDKLNVTYRSDPPLQPNEIIALLAVGRAPSTDPTLSARQAELDQATLGSIGATTLIGQALASPVTGRLQRFFGVSRIRIDPRLTGVENNPQTQLTLEQQVSKDITFTYITNLARGQEQVVRVEWNVNRRWSIVAVRDENGLFGIDFLFRKQFR